MAFRSNVDWLLLRTAFTVMQLAFLILTYLFLNYTTWFVDLTLPFAAALAYFTVAGFYSRAMVQRRNGSPLYSTVLEPGSSADVLLLACRISAPTAQRARIHRVLQQRAGLTRYGAAAPRLFESAPLFERLYQDVALFYWIAPPGRTCTRLADLFEMLERSLHALRDRGAESDVHFALHAAHFAIDERSNWAVQGKDALMAELLLVQRAEGGPITHSEAFAGACRACPNVTIPTLLTQAAAKAAGEPVSS